MADRKTIALFLSSKSVIIGNIAPISRDKCKFDRGFYMVTEELQPLTMICNYPNAKVYTL